MTETSDSTEQLWSRPLSRRTAMGALGAGILLVSAGCDSDSDRDPIRDCGDGSAGIERKEASSDPSDLTAYNWHIPGVERQPDGSLRVTPMPGETVPMNLYGARLDTKGDYAVGASIAMDPDTEFTLHFKDSVALSYDGFVQSPSGVRVTIDEHGGKVDVWRNEYDPPVTKPFRLHTAGREKHIVMQRQGARTDLFVDDQLVSEFADVFDSGRVWFGMAAKGGTSYVRELTARELPGGEVSITDTSTTTFPECTTGLATLAAKKVTSRGTPLSVGTAMRLAPFVENQRYGALLAGEFNSLTTENAGKFANLQPARGVFTFGELDAMADVAQRHNKELWLHTPVWHNNLPDWVKDAPPEQLEEIMLAHIAAVMGHTRGRIAGVDIVNEPLEEYNGRLRQSIWARYVPDYITKAAQAARRADPMAKIRINEYGWDKPNPKDQERFEALFTIAKRLKQRGILDSVGLQGHVLVSPRDKADIPTLRQRVDAFAKIGVEVHFTELDITESAGRTEQAEHMAAMLRLAVEHPNITNFTVWGIGGPYVSTANVRNPRVEIRTPWDVDLKPTPTYRELQNVLR